jgi:hypothetical protein
MNTSHETTIRSEEFRQHYGCTSIVDDWHHGMKITSGALHLTNAPDADVEDAVLVSLGW